MKWWQWLLLSLGIALALLLSVFLLWCYIRPSSASERKDFVQLIAQVYGVLGLAVTFYLTWRNLKLTQNTAASNLRTTQENLRLLQEEQITGRFTKAIEQLGNESLAIRLGGIYALERIARDSERDHWPIMEILTAYVREHSPWKAKEPDVEQVANDSAGKDSAGGLPPMPKMSWKREQEYTPLPPLPPLPRDIQAILTVLGRRNFDYEKGKDQYLDLSETDLRQAQFSMSSLKGIRLWNAHLERAQLICADLEGASFIGAHLEEAICSNANFRRACFSSAHLNKTEMNIADLEGTDLSSAIGLTLEQVKQAVNYDQAMLPQYLTSPDR